MRERNGFGAKRQFASKPDFNKLDSTQASMGR